MGLQRRVTNFVGPGYFVCRMTGGDARGDVVIDYTKTPGGKAESWPDIAPNERGVSRLVMPEWKILCDG